jgi:hypothetical protein
MGGPCGAPLVGWCAQHQIWPSLSCLRPGWFTTLRQLVEVSMAAGVAKEHPHSCTLSHTVDHTHTQLYTHSHIYTHTHVQSLTLLPTLILPHPLTHYHKHLNTHVCTHTYSCNHTHYCSQTHSHIYTHFHSHTHLHSHILTLTLTLWHIVSHTHYMHTLTLMLIFSHSL